MSSPAFTTLPPEIRARIYDFVWELGKGVSATCRLCHEIWMEEKSLLEDVPNRTMLALLCVNRQVSAEAASTFYGKRKFYVGVDCLVSFIERIGLRRHQIRDVEILHTPSRDTVLDKTMDTLMTLSSLQSLTIEVERAPMRVLEQHLSGLGVHQLTDYMNVTVVSRRFALTPCVSRSDWDGLRLWERVEFTKVWTCTKGETVWKSDGFRCRLLSRMNEENKWVSSENASQHCDHPQHRPDRFVNTDAFLSTTTEFLAAYMKLKPRGGAFPEGYHLEGNVLVPIPDKAS